MTDLERYRDEIDEIDSVKTVGSFCIHNRISHRCSANFAIARATPSSSLEVVI